MLIQKMNIYFKPFTNISSKELLNLYFVDKDNNKIKLLLCTYNSQHYMYKTCIYIEYKEQNKIIFEIEMKNNNYITEYDFISTFYESELNVEIALDDDFDNMDVKIE